MRPKIKISTLFAAGIICYIIGLYVIGFMNTPFLFILFFAIATFCLLITFFLLLTDLFWEILPPDKAGVYGNDKWTYRVYILAYLIFFLIAGWTINHYFLPYNKFHPVSLLGNAGILLFSAFLGWNLLKPNGKSILIGTASFILFVSLLTIVGSISDKDVVPSSHEEIKSLPYLTWVPAEKTIQKSGVTIHDQRQSFKGVNIYNSTNLSKAYLMDMSGDILHTWSAKMNEDDTWHHIEMDNNGDLLSIVEDAMLLRLDWNSNIKWVVKMPFHHDIAIAQNKDIYALRRKEEMVFISGLPVPILNDYIVVLSPNGEIKREISLFKVLKKGVPFNVVTKIYLWIINPKNLWEIVRRKLEGDYIFYGADLVDILHTNTIEIINRSINGLCKKGDILIAVRNLNLIGIIDLENEDLIWSWGRRRLSKPHHPSLLENGNILIYDNGQKREYSRIIELDPLTKKIVWKYRANPPGQFHSPTRGANQRLPNGNTLITESDSGRVFEITNNGQIVWEFYNPEIDTEEGTRAAIYRMLRLTHPKDYAILGRLK
ncbi:MAG TPA: arylsulfotransferase family protein [Thermodesulfobacteriota bacterium]|nr:arylsulfotransferase family protein [Thermodesulfobacteriota bacterium]